MSTDVHAGPPAKSGSASAVPLCPFSLTVNPVARMLNLELAEHPVYDGVELQWFDDDVHGTGLLAFLTRRADRRADYYVQPGLRLDRAGYQIGGGTGAWTETVFDVARLEVHADGVEAHVRFRDVDGRSIEVRIDDRDGRPRRRGRLLAPVGAGIDHPAALLLVWMRQFDLVRTTGAPPVISIDGRPTPTGKLPGVRLHRHHLIKYAGPLCAVEVNRAHDGPLPAARSDLVLAADRSHIAAVNNEQSGHRARLSFHPALPDLRSLAPDAAEEGGWDVTVDGARLTGGAWRAARQGDRVRVDMDVRDPWRPGPLPWLMRLVTNVARVFRQWPTTYRWHAVVELGDSPTVVSRWERLTPDRGQSYRRWTRS